MTQFPFWPVFWLITTATALLWRRTEIWEIVEARRVRQFWSENRSMQAGRFIGETILLFLGPLAMTHALALICQFLRVV